MKLKTILLLRLKKENQWAKILVSILLLFGYLDNLLIVLSVATGSISVASFATAIRAPVGIMSASCSLAFSVTTGFVKKFLKTIRNKKKKLNNIFMLARSKLNSIESKISEALINNQISHEDFMTILNKKRNIKNWNKELQWSTLKAVMLKKLVWLKKVKE